MGIKKGANEDRVYLFEQMPIPGAVRKLAIPTILSSLVMVLYNLADTYFVGLLNLSKETAAVTLAAPLLLAFNAVNNLFGVGASSMMSRALGQKDIETVKKSSAAGFYYALASGLLFSLIYTLLQNPFLTLLGADEGTAAATAEYLKWTVSFGAAPAILNVVLAYLVRAEGASLHASLGTMSGCFLNIILDPVFILPWGLHMGAAGAGLATFISNCAACLYFFCLLYFKRRTTCVCVKPQMAKPDRRVLAGICAVGIPASIQNLLNVTGMTILNNMTASFGESAVAAMGISHKISMVPMQIAFGLSQGIMPLVSYNFASRNHARMKKGFWYTARISLGFMACVTALLCLGSGMVVRMFMKDEAVIGYGTQFLRGFALGMPFLCMDFLAVGVFQACGMGMKSFVFAILRKIVLEIPALYLLNALVPLYGIAYAQCAAEIILSAVAVAVLTRFFKAVQKEGMEAGTGTAAKKGTISDN